MDDGPPPAWLVAGITVPSCLYLVLRFLYIFAARGRVISWHVRHSGMSMAFHVLLGMGLLATLPFLAWLCFDNTKPPTKTYWGPLVVIQIALVVVNLSIFRLMPHPSRFKEYKTTERIFVRSLAWLYVSGVQFSNMALSTMAFTFGGAVAALASTLLYIPTLLICYCEIRKIPWEKQIWAVFWFRHGLAHGPISKSNLISNAIKSGDDVLFVGFSIFLGIGSYALFQTASITRQLLFPTMFLPTDEGIDECFVVAVLYCTVTMSAGFFSLLQMDPETTPAPIYLADACLGQILPALITVVGPYWMSNKDSAAPFLWQWSVWTESTPW